MSSALYNRDILRLAASIPHHHRLDNPQGSADRRSVTCGSRVIADVIMDEEGRIAELGLDVRACALGQASAALLSAHGVGRTVSEIEQARDSLRVWLSDAGTEDEADFWPGMTFFSAARSYPARHPSILLSFEALAEASENAMHTAYSASEEDKA